MNASASRPASESPATGSPFGIAWFFLYGYSGVPAVRFLPALRALGGACTKVYLFWQQIEPTPGHYDWTAVDAFVEQLASPEEGLVSLFTTSLWATQRAATMLPPSPAKNPEDYFRFVKAVVSRCRGRVRYWQNDAEPNNPVFWSGSKEEFVAQLKLFHRAVKEADPAARVVVGGHDGLFVPPNLVPLPGQRTEPFPQQRAGLEFFDHVLREGEGAFDLFDLRLYGDPYTITARIQYFRERMRALGRERPFVCTEYGGPNFFEFAENRKYLPLVSSWSSAVERTDGGPQQDAASVNRIGELYATADTLAPQTRMFMQDCPPELEAKYHRLQSRSLVIRNVIALSAGVLKTFYWDLFAARGPRDDLMTLMYGKIGLLALGENGAPQHQPSAAVFARMAAVLNGVRAIRRLELPGEPEVFIYEVARVADRPLHVGWERRDQFSGEDLPARNISWPWPAPGVVAQDVFGAPVAAVVRDGRLEAPLSVTPVYFEGKASE